MAIKEMEVNREKIYRAIMRRDFYAFIHRCFLELNSKARFVPSWHVELVAANLDACRRGKIHRLIINEPPRNLKSVCGSVAYPAWILGDDPGASVLCVSYAQELAEKHSRDCRTVMNSAWYQRLFPTRLSAEKQSAQEFVTTKGGSRIATSVGGVLTGRGADFIIIDDPLKPSDALSDTRRREANEWYEHTLYSRLNDKRTGCIILIMQRLHEDDLVGHVLEREEWKVLSLPAIAQEDEEHVIETIYGKKRFTRRAGEALHPEREPLEVLGRIKATLGEYNFASQYLQQPAPLEGGLVKAAWFKTYTEEELPGHFDQIVQSWDTANKPTELADYSVCTTWGVKAKKIYLLNVFRRKLNYPDLKRAVREQADMHEPTVVLIEDRASGTQLIQELVDEGLETVKAVTPEGDKVMRFNAQTATVENGFVYLPSEAPWVADFIHEITTFPNCKYDDQADSTTQALAWIKQNRPNDGWLAWLRQQNALSLHQQGDSIEHIALKTESSVEEVKRWIREYQDTELARLYPSAYGYRCGGCGCIIPPNTTPFQMDAGVTWHPECLRKRSLGM